MRSRLIVATLAMSLIMVSALVLRSHQAGIAITTDDVGETPVSVYRPAINESAPVVVIAHGFAGSRTLMESFALSLARSGYLAVTFDFLGHGRHPQPLVGSIMEESGATQALVRQLAQVGAYARDLAGSDGRLALIGHSMAADIVVRQATADPAIEATVGVSMFAPTVTADQPRNLLIVAGGLETRLREEGLRLVQLFAGEAAVPGVTYESPRGRNSRRFEVAPGVEHVGVLYSRHSLETTVAWLDRVMHRDGPVDVVQRGPWLVALLAGVITLGWPLAGLLPVLSARRAGAGLCWRRLWPLLIIPAAATPLLLWPVPTAFLPVLVADYLAVHFAVYGLVGLVLLRLREGWRIAWPGWRRVAATAVAVAVVLAYGLGVVGFAVDQFLTSFYPVGVRWTLLLAMIAGTLPYFLVDEWICRGEGSARGARLLSPVLFILSLGIAVALDFRALFFLIIIVPIMVVFFLVYGLFSNWIYRRCGSPLVGGVMSAVVFAWALAVTFPVLAQ